MSYGGEAFDNYVSLGNNCETAFQIRRVLSRDSSSFFSWNVTMVDPLLSILSSNFANVVQLENMTNVPETGLMHDASHDFHVHSSFATKDFRTEPGFEESFRDLTAKFDYLKTKFAEDAASDKRTVYFYKTEAREDIRVKAQSLRDVLARFHGGNRFALVIVQPLSALEPPWSDDCIYNRYLRRLAPWEDATDGHVMSWDAVFREFPHRDGLHLAGF